MESNNAIVTTGVVSRTIAFVLAGLTTALVSIGSAAILTHGTGHRAAASAQQASLGTDVRQIGHG
jgi:putative flippase GtrA